MKTNKSKELISFMEYSLNRQTKKMNMPYEMFLRLRSVNK